MTETKSNPLQLADQPGETSPLAVQAAARVQAEIQSAYLMAIHHKRDEALVWPAVAKTLKDAAAAEKAYYSYPRGGGRVFGPSVRLARELARVWGNMRSGVKIIEITDEFVHIAGWALDLQTNAYSEFDDRFAKLIQRTQGSGQNKKTVWIQPDERDLRELIARRGAILERNCILKLLPRHKVNELVDDAMKTHEMAVKGLFHKSKEKAVEAVVSAFADLGVSGDMLAVFLGHPVSQLDDDEYAALVGIGKQIKDGTSHKSEYFDGTSHNVKVNIGKMKAPDSGSPPKQEVEPEGTSEMDSPPPEAYEDHPDSNATTPAGDGPPDAQAAPQSDSEPEKVSEDPQEAKKPPEAKAATLGATDYKAFGAYTKTGRKSNKLTYGHIKEATGLSVGQIAQVEKGTSEMIASLSEKQITALAGKVHCEGDDADDATVRLLAWTGQ